MVRRVVLPGALLAAAALLAAGCSGVGSSADPGTTPAADASSMPASTSPSASASPSSSPSDTPSVPPTPGLGHKKIGYGQHGKRVKALQKRLKALHYDPGKVDGAYGANTLYAVWAFDTVNGFKPHRTVGKHVLAALADPKSPKALKPHGPANRVEINLAKQYLTVYKRGEVALISHVSSGSGRHYCDTWKDDDTGQTGTSCGVAVTPTGNYRTYRRIEGWRHSKLGYLYNPVYFNGGIAVHGEPYVPTYPASHGCVRIPMHTSTIFPKLVGHGERVYVRD